MGTGFSRHLHDRRKKFQSLAAGRSLLSTYAPPPPDVPPANIQLMARTRDGLGLFMRCEQMWAGIVPFVSHEDKTACRHKNLRRTKNHFPTNNQMGYLIRVMQAAV